MISGPGMSARSAISCSQCGEAADPKSAYSVRLVANPGHGVEAIGYEVARRGGLDEVRVNVPRCIRCKVRTRRSNAVVPAGALAGAVVGPIFWSTFGQRFRVPAWLHFGYQSEGILGTPVALGLVIGFIVALLGVAFKNHRLHLRSVTDYPAVLKLRQEGWNFPSG